jgi:hypothetical protein
LRGVGGGVGRQQKDARDHADEPHRAERPQRA